MGTVIMFADMWSLPVSGSVLLSLAAALGYLFGLRRTSKAKRANAHNRHEIVRALAVAKELESITYRLRKSLGDHVPAVVKFNTRLTRLEETADISWQELCDRADELLKPAMRLSTEVAHAYAELTQQMAHLSTFAELRTDPLTNIANRRAFDESLESAMSQYTRRGTAVSLAILDIDFFKRINDEQGHLQGDRALQELAVLLRANVRECDTLARYGGEEFVILMPHTELHSACNLCERMRGLVQANCNLTVSIGLATVVEGDTTTSLLSRADDALYAAKDAGRNHVCYHEGPGGRIVGINLANGEKILAEPKPIDVEATLKALSDDDLIAEVAALHQNAEPVAVE